MTALPLSKHSAPYRFRVSKKRTGSGPGGEFRGEGADEDWALRFSAALDRELERLGIKQAAWCREDRISLSEENVSKLRKGQGGVDLVIQASKLLRIAPPKCLLTDEQYRAVNALCRLWHEMGLAFDEPTAKSSVNALVSKFEAMIVEKLGGPEVPATPPPLAEPEPGPSSVARKKPARKG
jgi:hypothetical protein